MIAQSVAAGLGPREKFTTVYSGMEIDRFDPALHDRAAVRREWGVPDDAVVAGSVARLFRNKGYEDLIPAMAIAAKASPDLRFVWIGDGAQRGEYEERLQRLGLRDRVTLTGLVPPDEIPRLLRGVDLLTHASRWEGLPRAVVQALLMEKPAVSFDIDGAPEVVIPGETGLLVALGDQGGLADAMVRLAGDADLRRRMGVAGRGRCLSLFDRARLVEGQEALYERLVAERAT
jgi:glycosyltransferase involved in cell wall biosynthesis